MKRVFVCGYGARTPSFCEGKRSSLPWQEALPHLIAGQTAVHAISHFDVSGFPSQVAAWIGEDATSEQGDRRVALLQAAIDDLGERSSDVPSGTSLGVFVGAESGRAAPDVVTKLCQQSTDASGKFSLEQFQIVTERGSLSSAALSRRAVSPAAVTTEVARRFQARGPAQTVSLACASSLAALVSAVRQLRSGVCSNAIVCGVGTDVDPFMLAGFGKLGALSGRGHSVPFDQRRDGFVVGEGAAALWLSTDPCRQPLAEVLGVGASVDAYHLTAPHPNGVGAESAMRAALVDAGLDRVDYVQAHGTSTLLNDAVECQALERAVRGTYHLSSIKGALGHWIAGAGALGTIAAIEALHGNVLPTAGLEQIDSACPGLHVQNRALHHVSVETAMVNAFAFGGANVSVVLGKV